MKKLLTRGLAFTAVAIVLTGCVSDADDNKSSSIFEAQPDIKVSENADDNTGSETENIVGQSANSESSQSDEATEENDYSRYSGVWTLDGAPVRDSGACLNITINEGNKLEGDIFTLQALSGRDAEIENISATIEDGQCSYYFTDDGWEGSGTLIITLKDEKIHVEVQDYVMPDSNVIGYGIHGSYDFVRLDESNKNPYDLQKYSEDWDEEQISEELEKRAQYRDCCFFYKDYIEYMEQERNCTDIAVYCYPIFDTDKRYYEASEFSDAPWIVINIAKNEIYARHGYIFTDPDVYDFFMGQLWYVPEVEAEDFDDAVFNEYEKANLELLNSIQ